MPSRFVIGLLGSVALLSTVGCGGMFQSGATPLTPPVISALQVEPLRLRFTGGQITVSVSVRDDEGLRTVNLVVISPDGSRSSLPMVAAGQDIFRATATLLANPSGNSQSYQVFVEAEDRVGVRAQSATQVVEVESLSLPPGAPPI